METFPQMNNTLAVLRTNYITHLYRNDIEEGTPKDITIIFGLTDLDTNNVKQSIVNNFTIQGTSFPGLIIDVENKAAFYDFFVSSNKNTAEQRIYNTYLLKKVIDYAYSIKFIFAMPKSEFDINSNGNFISLLDNFLRMVKNIKSFENSVALIVTNTDVVDNGVSAASDDSVVTKIITYLENTKEHFQNQDEESELEVKGKIKLIEILLRREAGKRTNIGVIRNSKKFNDELANEKAFQSNRNVIKSVVYDNTEFSFHDKADFNYNISSNLIINLPILDEKVSRLITLDIAYVVQDIKRYYRSLQHQLNDMEELSKLYNLAHSSFQTTVLKTFSDPQNFLNEMTENIKKLNISISETNIMAVNNHMDYHQFLKYLQNERYTNVSLSWTRQLNVIIRYLEDSQKWYNILMDFQKILSAYYIQNNVSQYTKIVDDILQSISVYNISKAKNDGVNIVKNIKILLNNANIDDKEVENICISMNSIPFSKVKLNFLSKLLSIIFDPNALIESCSEYDSKLIVKGQYVKLSDVIKSNCTKAKKVQIFASNKVFIDDDFSRIGEEVELSIIAPTWEIIDERKIILDGNPGHPWEPRTAVNIFSEPGRDGVDGKAGKPGGPAGSFLGIGLNVINPQNLHISVVGGTGGPGQDGANGIDGSVGTTPAFPENGPKFLQFQEKCVEVGLSPTREPNTFLQNKIISSGQRPMVYRCIIEGKHCTDGGKGGRGGAGGIGGNTGGAKMFEIAKAVDSNIMIDSLSGKNGTVGTQGNGKAAGKNGNLITFDVHEFQTNILMDNHFRYVNKSVINQPECISNINITMTVNFENLDRPKRAEAKISAHSINEYKHFIRESLHDNMNEHYITRFLDQMENYPEIKDLYNAHEFIDELKNLENQYYGLHKKLSFAPFYKSLLDRIMEYINKNKHMLNDDDRKVLNYVYTATLSKIVSIRNRNSNNLILNLSTYLESVNADIKDLEDLNNRVFRDMIQMNNDKIIEDKITEATNFIKPISTEIDHFINNLDKQIDIMMKKIVRKEKEEENKIKETHDLQLKLKKALVLKKLLSIPKITGQMLSFMLPVGAAAGTAVSATAMVVEALAIDVQSSRRDALLHLPTELNIPLMKVMGELRKKKDMFRDKIMLLDSKIRRYTPAESDPYSIGELKQEIFKLEKEIENEYIDENTLDNMNKKKENIINLLRNLKSKIDKEQLTTSENTDNKLRLLNHLQIMVNMLNVPVEVYNKFTKDDEKISELASSIEQAYHRINQLEEYESNIYKIILPMCRNLQGQIEALKSESRDKSHAALDISKWQIQNTLNDVRFQIKQLTKEFDLQENIMHFMEKLDSGLTFMINIYDHIQSYRDKKELSDYIKNISSKAALDKQLNNKALEEDINKLKLIIQSNIVLGIYEKALNAFGQHIYPFINIYLKKLYLPSDIEPNDFDSLVTYAAKGIKHIERSMTHYITEDITISNATQTSVAFRYGNERAGPFFVWNNRDHKDAISKLLSGKQITLNSDITKGLNKNAVKFSDIGIYFSLLNKTLEEELYKQLRHFDITMTHLGTSHYRCNDKIHLIMHNEIPLSHSLGHSKDSELYQSTQFFARLRKHDAILSPYTMWNVKITAVGNNTFDLLRNYKNSPIDLQLIGFGQYVSDSINDEICNDDLSNHYQLDNTISGINRIEINKKEHLGDISDKPKTDDYRRSKRSSENIEFAQSTENNSFATSGASSAKSSIINNIFNLAGIGLFIYDYFNPVNKIKQWFGKDPRNINNGNELMLENDLPVQMRMLNIGSLGTELQTVSNLRICDKSTAKDITPNYEPICSQGNLLLLDLLIRSRSRIKHNVVSVRDNNNFDLEYAQNLAYKSTQL